MNPPFSPEALAWLGETLRSDSKRFRFARLAGSTSSTLFCIECREGARTERYVLRLLDNRAWLAEEPDLAEHEWAALGEARRAGLRAPAPIAYQGAGAGFGVPVVLMSFVEGEVRLLPGDFGAWIERMVFELAAIHACLGPPGVEARPLPHQTRPHVRSRCRRAVPLGLHCTSPRLEEHLRRAVRFSPQ